MDARCLEHLLTEDERLRFERDGYFTVENALPQSLVDSLIPTVDRVDKAERVRMHMAADARINHFDFIGKDDSFLELLDWHTTFPKVWDLLNWHIQLYHTHMTVSPPEAEGKTLAENGLGLGWHQDSGRLNNDFETSPRPRVSLKIAYFLTDTREKGRATSTYCPAATSKMTFLDPIEKSPYEDVSPYESRPARPYFLIGVTHSGGRGYTSPTEADIPLKHWIEEHVQPAPAQ